MTTKKGRPSHALYNKDRPEELKQLMAKGMLDSEIIAKWDIATSTFYQWKKDHEEFAAAHEVGLNKLEAFYLNLCRTKGLKGEDKGFKWIQMILKNKLGYDKEESRTSTQINIQHMNVLQNKTDAELIDFIQDKLLDIKVIDIPLIEEYKNESSE